MIEYPLVSVAIITYNQKKFLAECIESVLAQDYPNIEIIVADDCSTDGTQEMLRKYSERHPGKFILKLANKNQGITLNSNVAHFACSGKYIAWMGGDDLMLPGKISKQVKHMEKNPDCTICYHNLDVFQSETNETLRLKNGRKTSLNGDVRTAIKFGAFNGACSNMVRRSKTPPNGFNLSLPVASDWLYWVETLANGGNLFFINEVLGRQRRHENNVTKQQPYITQHELDHLVSCQIIMARYPQYLSECFFVYSRRLLDLRFKLNYFKVLKTSLAINFRLKPFVAIVIYLLSFKKVKL